MMPVCVTGTMKQIKLSVKDFVLSLRGHSAAACSEEGCCVVSHSYSTSGKSLNRS